MGGREVKGFFFKLGDIKVCLYMDGNDLIERDKLVINVGERR